MMVQEDSGLPWPRVSVVVPVLNEARNLPRVFAQMPPDVNEVILVDGDSVDGTVTVARQLRPDVRIVMQTGRGKENALACGLAVATGDILAMFNGDGSADPGEIPRFVKALLDGADFAQGTRFAKGGGSNEITRFRRLGNRVLSGLVSVLGGMRCSDLCYGYNVVWRRHVPVLGLDAAPSPAPGGGVSWGDGFEVETLIHMRVAQARLVVAEVPSFEHPRVHRVSNLNALGDGMRVLQTILTERRRAHRPPPTAAVSAHAKPQVTVAVTDDREDSR
jgi:glycosyltransferase involved in cell wall biosynthesis